MKLGAKPPVTPAITRAIAGARNQAPLDKIAKQARNARRRKATPGTTPPPKGGGRK